MKNHLPHDFDEKIDQDSVWNLLENSTPAEPSGTFVQDTLRRARLESQEKESWWKKLTSPFALAGLSATTVAAIALVVTLNSEPTNPTPPVAIEDTPAPETTVEWTELEDALAGELLATVSEEPSLLSDQELVALLF
ncbi:MAG: hypothetical protein ACSHYF_06810 [Verrucomicrobiaceae bacterium]